MTFNFSNTTQTGSDFGVTAISQNGYTTGKLTGINISSTGVVQAQYTNGNSANLGQIAIANFANPQGLQQLGNQSWAQTFASGAAVTGQAGNSGVGTHPVRLARGVQRRHHERSGQHDHRRSATSRRTRRCSQTDDQITQTIINIHGQA